MPIIIDEQTYQNLLSKGYQQSVDAFWDACTKEWFGCQSRMATLYVEQKQSKEAIINHAIIQRSYGFMAEFLPSPDENQRQMQKYYLTEWEGTPTTYHFYDISTKKPTLARWLRKFLDKWDTKLNDPFADEVVAHRSLNGSIKKGKPQDPLLDCYLKNRGNINPVLVYCQTLTDLTVMEATSNIGGSRGPFGEFASAADKALKEQIKKLNPSHNKKLSEADRYDLLINSGSKFFLTINALKNAFNVFASTFKQSAAINSDQKYEVDIDLLSPCIVVFCNALKSTVERAIQFKKFLQDYFLSDDNQHDQINSLMEQLFKMIAALSLKACDFINAKLAEVALKGYDPALDVNPSSIAKIELLYSEAEIEQLLKDKMNAVVAAQTRPRFFQPAAESVTSPREQQGTPSSTPRRSRSHRSLRKSGKKGKESEQTTATPRQDQLRRGVSTPRSDSPISSRYYSRDSSSPHGQTSSTELGRSALGSKIMDEAAAKLAK
jgi:hypothetical protein